MRVPALLVIPLTAFRMSKGAGTSDTIDTIVGMRDFNSPSGSKAPGLKPAVLCGLHMRFDKWSNERRCGRFVDTAECGILNPGWLFTPFHL